MTAAADKVALRRQLRRERAALPSADRRRAALRAARHLAAALRGTRVWSIAIYLRVGSELDTAPLLATLARTACRILVPRIDPHAEGRMTFVEWLPGARVRRNRHGIPEPMRARRTRGASPDVIVLPLVGFDREGHRLGSGAGFYDRWLATQRGHRPRLIGYAFAMQEVASIPAEPWDVPMDAVCTERGVRRRLRAGGPALGLS